VSIVYGGGYIHRVQAMTIIHEGRVCVPPALCGADLPANAPGGSLGPLVTTAGELVTCPACKEATMPKLRYRDEHEGPEYHYLSRLRPVASIGYASIPGMLIEPGSDPHGTRRDFYTAEPLSEEFRSRLDLTIISHQCELGYDYGLLTLSHERAIANGVHVCPAEEARQ